MDMSADVLELVPRGGRADDTIRRTVDALMKGKGIRPGDVATAAGMSRSTFFAKMSGRGSRQAFKAGEVADIAHFLGVPVGQLYDGLGGTFVPPNPPTGWAPRDSNPEPTGFTREHTPLQLAA